MHSSHWECYCLVLVKSSSWFIIHFSSSSSYTRLLFLYSGFFFFLYICFFTYRVFSLTCIICYIYDMLSRLYYKLFHLFDMFPHLYDLFVTFILFVPSLVWSICHIYIICSLTCMIYWVLVANVFVWFLYSPLLITLMMLSLYFFLLLRWLASTLFVYGYTLGFNTLDIFSHFGLDMYVVYSYLTYWVLFICNYNFVTLQYTVIYNF